MLHSVERQKAGLPLPWLLQRGAVTFVHTYAAGGHGCTDAIATRAAAAVLALKASWRAHFVNL